MIGEEESTPHQLLMSAVSSPYLGQPHDADQPLQVQIRRGPCHRVSQRSEPLDEKKALGCGADAASTGAGVNECAAGPRTR
jgi:hypothetical protein